MLIEAHVLQVSLSDEERHGIDWRGLANPDGTKITLEGSGFADTPSGSPALTLQIDGRDSENVAQESFVRLVLPVKQSLGAIRALREFD